MILFRMPSRKEIFILRQPQENHFSASGGTLRLIGFEQAQIFNGGIIK